MNTKQLKLIANNIDDQINDLSKPLRRKQDILQCFINWDFVGGIFGYSEREKGFVSNFNNAPTDTVWFYDEVYTELQLKTEFGNNLKTMFYADFFKQNGIEI